MAASRTGSRFHGTFREDMRRLGKSWTRRLAARAAAAVAAAAAAGRSICPVCFRGDRAVRQRTARNPAERPAVAVQ